jgi:membrane-associated phospholipid phosphatase
LNKPTAITGSTIVGRLLSELGLKLVLMLALNLWVYVPYCFLQRHSFFQPTMLPASFLDRLIPFSDKAVWIYLSIYLLMPIGPFLMANRRQITRYALGVVLISILADLVFLFWPTLCPRPGAGSTIAAYRTLVSLDYPLHALPSLHAAFAVFSALCAGQVFRELGTPALWRSAVWVWALFILFATLLTKQHVIVDVAAGSVLAFGVYFFVFYQWNSKPKATEPFQSVAMDHTQPNTLL